MLRNEDTGISRSHYLRLMALGLIDIILWLPLSLTFLILDLMNMKIQSYQSWSHVHIDFGRVVFVPIDTFIHGNHSVYVAAELGRWIGPTLALNFFIFFGIKPEVWASYWGHFIKFKNIMCWRRRVPACGNSNADTFDDVEDKTTPMYVYAYVGWLTDLRVQFQLGAERAFRTSRNSLPSSLDNSLPDIDIEKADHLDTYAAYHE